MSPALGTATTEERTEEVIGQVKAKVRVGVLDLGSVMRWGEARAAMWVLVLLE